MAETTSLRTEYAIRYTEIVDGQVDTITTRTIDGIVAAEEAAVQMQTDYENVRVVTRTVTTTVTDWQDA